MRFSILHMKSILINIYVILNDCQGMISSGDKLLIREINLELKSVHQEAMLDMFGRFDASKGIGRFRRF